MKALWVTFLYFLCLCLYVVSNHHEFGLIFNPPEPLFGVNR